MKALPSKKTALADILGECYSLAHAIRMASPALEDSKNPCADACAFDVIAMTLGSRIEDARCIIDTMKDEPQ
jgi:hypothetical protein